MTHKKGLGKGINALFGQNISNDESVSDNESVNISSDDKNVVIEADINKIEPNKNQPRTSFDEEKIAELAESIKEIGIVQPIVVKKNGDFFMIIAGERRWRAARKAGLKTIPVIIREYDEAEALEASLIENIQRENLNPLEEAFTYKKFYDEFNFNQETIAKKVGKSRTAVTNSMRLLNLDKRVQNFLKENKLSGGHARALLSISNGDLQFEAAEKVIEESLSVRMTEDFVKNFLENIERQNLKNENEKEKKAQPNSEMYNQIAKSLNDILGTKVNIKNGRNKGKIEIEYYSEEELDRLICLFKAIPR
ncbi:MAG: ParB/RepB/Spo0J family partition protein [Clostridiales bacterium]|jgi:ParB family chromosome partitioning protein|nr:ParB/RepB/Spo0J family partition protein [Clostridiales bacterium]